jgi:hypothetical protein
MMFVPQMKHTYGHPIPVSGIALLIYMYIIFVPDRKPTYAPPRIITGISLLYENDLRTSKKTTLLASTACYSKSCNYRVYFIEFPFMESSSLVKLRVGLYGLCEKWDLFLMAASTCTSKLLNSSNNRMAINLRCNVQLNGICFTKESLRV